VRATSLRGQPTSGRSNEAEILAAVTENLWPLVAKDIVKPVVQAKIPVTAAVTGHQLLDAPETGKVVLLVR
jgi:NADPH2:quinone reductase